jgi:uncharacterized RDD family membrane protein YckC
MADRLNSPEPRTRANSPADDRSRLEALTLTYQRREHGDTPDCWLDALAPGSVLGPYRTVRLLGQGGMGLVYEAEEIETGRRVALKVLSAERRRDIDRERFQREGRLAASLNHPHCVFVFGAWELAGELLIAMELMRDTLAGDRGPHESRSATAAVDAVLDVIAGLDAAARAGILHRDVKPSNCFVDDDGRVKIGDFGISISAHVPDDSSQRGLGLRVVGTPAYASPEQLRGHALDVRSDIYGVGATLYELVTGHVPFERNDLMALLMAVANDAPRAPHLVNPTIPRGLSALIVRCLAKEPERRYASYDELATALEPYASSAPAAAPLNRRCVAGLVDVAILCLPLIASTMGPLLGGGLDRGALSAVATPFVWALTAWTYFSVFEGAWGASPGKWLTGLAVVGANRQPARLPPIVGRAGLWALCLLSIRLLSSAEPPLLEQMLPGPVAFLALQSAALLPLLLLLSTARRWNDHAGLHDLLTGTRVVERCAKRPRAKPAASTSPPRRNVVGRAGPYDVLAEPVRGLGDAWRWGYDARLSRLVWLRLCAPDIPPVASDRRALTRRTRLRWLSGRRLEGDAWDAYESVDGVPLLDTTRDPRPWAEVRWWLLDIARECVAMAPSDRAPRQPRHIWVLTSGGAKWVDDPVAVADRDEVATDRELLSAVAHGAGLTAIGPDGRLRARPPLPLAAWRFVERLHSSPLGAAADDVRALETLTRQRAVLTRTWRLLPVAILALMLMVPLAIGTMQQRSAQVVRDRVTLDHRVAAAVLSELLLANHKWLAMSSEDRASLEVALATRYRDSLGNLFVPERIGDLRLGTEHREIARDVLRRYPTNVGDSRAIATPRVEATISRVTRYDTVPWYRALHARTKDDCLSLALVALLVGVFFRGGLLRAAGLEIVTACGEPAGRVCLFVRALLTWSPILLLPWVDPAVARVLPGAAQSPWWMAGMLGGVIAVTISPARALQDRVTGTWIVPR